MKKDKVKKRIKLYRAMFESLRADDKFVVATPLDHDALIAKMASAMKDVGLFYVGADYWRHVAEAALSALVWADREFLESEYVAQEESDMRGAPIRDTEADYQHFLSYGQFRDHPDLRQAYYAGAHVSPPDVPRETRDGDADFDPRTHLMTEPPDHEADFQDFLGAYDMPARIERLLRVAYLVGVADAQAPEV